MARAECAGDTAAGGVVLAKEKKRRSKTSIQAAGDERIGVQVRNEEVLNDGGIIREGVLCAMLR